MYDARISVIITIYNAEQTIEGCIRTVALQDHPNYEVILVDDGSTDATLKKIAQLVRNQAKFRIISLGKNQGVPAARNAGIQAAKGQVYVFTDADCTFDPQWLSKLIVPLSQANVGCSGGPDEAPGNSNVRQKCIDYAMNSFVGAAGLRRGEMRLGKYSPAGCNMAVKREVLQRVGLFDENLRWRGEEKELEHRIRKAGYKIVYVRNAVVWHWRRNSMRSFWAQNVGSGKARMDILRTAPDAFEVVHIAPALFFLAFSSGIFFSFFSKAARYICGYGLLSYVCLLLIHGIVGAVRIKDARSLFMVPLASIMIHFGYGAGIIIRFFKKNEKTCDM